MSGTTISDADIPISNDMTARDMYKCLLPLVETARFAAREMTIAASMDLLTDRGFDTESLGRYEKELRGRVPLEPLGV